MISDMRIAVLFLVLTWLVVGPARADDTGMLLPAGTPVFLQLQEAALSTFGNTDWAPSKEGDVLEAVVWRDVVVDRFILVHAGAGARVRVAEIVEESQWGGKGEITISPVAAVAADGQVVDLTGDFRYSGEDAHAREFVIGMFSYGMGGSSKDAARLDPGNIISSRISADVRVAVTRNGAQADEVPPDALLARLMLESLERGKKIRRLPIELSRCEERVIDPEIVAFNGEEIRPLPLKTKRAVTRDGCSVVETELEFRRIADRFETGVNWLEIESGGQRAEIIVLPSEIMHGKRP
jgi:hypothetical protein